MATWEAMICCQCGHPTAPMPYSYRWMTSCHVCSHKACLACNLSSPVEQDSNLHLNQGQEVPRLESITPDASNIYDLTEAGNTRAENGGKSDLEIQEILGNGQFGEYECEDLQAASNLGEYEDFLNFVETPAPQSPPPFQQRFFESTPIPSIHLGPGDSQPLDENTDIFNGETHAETIEEQIARMPRNFEAEVLETWAWIDRFSPLPMENREEIPDVQADEPFFLPEGANKPDNGFSAAWN